MGLYFESQSKRAKLEDPFPISRAEQRKFNDDYLAALQEKLPGVDLLADMRSTKKLYYSKFCEVDGGNAFFLTYSQILKAHFN